MAHIFTITISDEEYAAFERVVVDPDDWVDHAARNKVRKCMLRVVEATLRDTTNLLSQEDKDTLQSYLVSNDLVMVPWKEWPQSILRQISAASLMPTRVEADAAGAAAKGATQ